MQTTQVITSTAEFRVCPKCSAHNAIAALQERQYRCSGCAMELAHVDLAPNGSVRGIFGWVLAPGTLVHDRYRIAAVLGRGGFGVTYLADDQRFAGKRRALKEIPRLLFDEYETHLLGRLSHPAVPDIIDRFDTETMEYLVLEFGGTRTLRTEQEVNGGHIPIFKLIPWMEQVCDALVYLHSQTPPIIHRDLKPDNILLDDYGRVMLIDFGISKEKAGDNQTRTLGRAVTHGYSPPEQVLGTGTDACSDIYAVGAILYTTITGRVPPAAQERITGTVLEPPSHFVPTIPPLLDAAICQALELNLRHRQKSVAELAETLALVRNSGASSKTVFVDTLSPPISGTGHPSVRLSPVEFPSQRVSERTRSEIPGNFPVAPVLPTRQPAWWPLAGAVLAGALLAAGGGWLYLKPGDERQTTGSLSADTRPAPAPAGRFTTPVADARGGPSATVTAPTAPDTAATDASAPVQAVLPQPQAGTAPAGPADNPQPQPSAAAEVVSPGQTEGRPVPPAEGLMPAAPATVSASEAATAAPSPGREESATEPGTTASPLRPPPGLVAPPPTPPPASQARGSLMSDFERYRANAQAKRPQPQASPPKRQPVVRRPAPRPQRATPPRPPPVVTHRAPRPKPKVARPSRPADANWSLRSGE